MSGVAMDLGRYLVEAVLQEGRSPSELAAAHGVSRSWVYELLARHRADPEHGLEARSRRPGRSPTQVSIDIEERVVALRKELTGGASTPAPTRSTTTSPGPVDRCRQPPRSGGSSNGGASSRPNPRSGPARHWCASRPTCPTSAGRPTPPTGPSPMAPTSRSSTSSTTTPGSSSRPSPTHHQGRGCGCVLPRRRCHLGLPGVTAH